MAVCIPASGGRLDYNTLCFKLLFQHYFAFCCSSSAQVLLAQVTARHLVWKRAPVQSSIWAKFLCPKNGLRQPHQPDQACHRQIAQDRWTISVKDTINHAETDLLSQAYFTKPEEWTIPQVQAENRRPQPPSYYPCLMWTVCQV